MSGDHEDATPAGTTPAGTTPAGTTPAGGRHATSGKAPADATDDQRRSLMNAFGGGRGLFETSLPGLVFVTVFAFHHDVKLCGIIAVAVGAVLLAIRLIRRETTQYAIGGFVGVVIAALFAISTGQAKNYFALGILKNLGFMILYAGSVLVKWPLLGVVLGPLLKENMAWRQVAERRRAYATASLIWAAMFAVRLAILLPLYLLDKTVVLGVAGVVLGWPVFGAVLYATWLVLRRVPPVRVDEPRSGHGSEPEPADR